MENEKTIQNFGQSVDDIESENFDAFINTMVSIIEKYGKLVLQDLDYVA